MARLFTSGFEQNSTTAGIEWSTLGNAAAINTVTKRTGTYAQKVSGLVSGGSNGLMYQFLSVAAGGPYFLDFEFYLVTPPSIDVTIGGFGLNATFATLQGADPHILLTSTGAVKLMNGTAQIGSTSSALSANAWHRVQMQYKRVSNGSDILELIVDGSTVATTSAGTLQQLTVKSIFLGGNCFFEANTAGEWYFDDVALNDSSGSNQTSYPTNAPSVIVLRPNAAGEVNTFATQTGGTAGSANNFTRVNEVTPDDATTLNGSSTLNQEDLFDVDASGIGASDVVNVVHINGRFRNSTADATAAFKFEVEKAASGTLSLSSAIVPNSTTWKTNALAAPTTPPIILYKDPDGVNAWTQTTLDSMRIGYKLTVGPGTAGRRVDVSSVWATVDYTPATTPLPSVFDSTTVSEFLQFNVVDRSSVFDNVTTSDVVVDIIRGNTRDIRDPFDSTTVSESVTMRLISNLSVNDTAYLSTRNNYVVNPGFETNDLWWGAAGPTPATKAQDATEFLFGTKSLKMVGAAVDDRAYFTIGDGLASSTIGNPYTFSIYLKGSGTVRLWVYDGSVDQFSANITLTSTWTRYSITYTAQATTGMFAGVRQNAAGACTAYLDGALLETGSLVSPFFDGDNGGSWSGSANNSISSWVGESVTTRVNLLPSISDSVYTFENEITYKPTTTADPVAKRVVHVGSYSIDYNNLSQASIDAMVLAITTNIPNADYIAIGMYLDYTTQISRWATSIHAAGKKMWLRTGGFNDWQGYNSVAQYTASDFADNHRTRMLSWLQSNAVGIFQSGDLFEAVPDEPENNSMWVTWYTSIGTVAGKNAYNDFIQQCIRQADAKFIALGITGIDVKFVFTNPSASRDIIDVSTRSLMSAMGTEDYPESGQTTAAGMQTAMESELDTWVVGAQDGKGKHITMGPSVWAQLTESMQTDVYIRHFNTIKDRVKPLNGITVWSAGSEDNSSYARLFDYTGGVWVPRLAVATINSLFASLAGAIVVVDVPTLNVISRPNVNDSTTVSESVTIVIPTLVPNVNDAVSVTESVVMQLVSYVNVNDPTTVLESVTLQIILNANVNDPTTVSESTTILIPILVPSVVDTATVTESVTMMIVSQGQVVDTVSVTEFVKMELLSPTVSDAVTVTDVPTVEVRVTPSVFDAITVSEAIILAPILVPSVSDATTVSENVSIQVTVSVNVNDAVTCTENLTIRVFEFISVNDTVSTTESVTVVIPTLVPNVNDTVSVSESISLFLPVLSVVVNDTVTTTESITLLTIGQGVVIDTVSVTEFVKMELLSPSVSDTVTVTESVTTEIRITPNVNDTISVTESVTIIIPTLVPSVSDTVSVSESISLGVQVGVQVTDQVAVAEFVAIQVTISVNVSDSVSTTEAITLFKTSGNININVSDSVSVSEFLAMTLTGYQLTTFDLVITQDVVALELLEGENPAVNIDFPHTVHTFDLSQKDVPNRADDIPGGITMPFF